ncbi:MAG: hypothetical protein KAI89_06075 [Emcibacter sp.]|nr:hypothetical protein [Emcibacter sp.]
MMNSKYFLEYFAFTSRIIAQSGYVFFCLFFLNDIDAKHFVEVWTLSMLVFWLVDFGFITSTLRHSHEDKNYLDPFRSDYLIWPRIIAAIIIIVVLHNDIPYISTAITLGIALQGFIYRIQIHMRKLHKARAELFITGSNVVVSLASLTLAYLFEVNLYSLVIYYYFIPKILVFILSLCTYLQYGKLSDIPLSYEPFMNRLQITINQGANYLALNIDIFLAAAVMSGKMFVIYVFTTRVVLQLTMGTSVITNRILLHKGDWISNQRPFIVETLVLLSLSTLALFVIGYGSAYIMPENMKLMSLWIFFLPLAGTLGARYIFAYVSALLLKSRKEIILNVIIFLNIATYAGLFWAYPHEKTIFSMIILLLVVNLISICLCSGYLYLIKQTARAN